MKTSQYWRLQEPTVTNQPVPQVKTNDELDREAHLEHLAEQKRAAENKIFVKPKREKVIEPIFYDEPEMLEEPIIVQDKKTVPPPFKKDHDERRKQKRHTAEFKIILISGSNSFRSVSQDISLGGIRLKKRVPEGFLESNCVAYISYKDSRENIEVVCNVIPDSSDPCRIQFKNPKSEQLERLAQWIQEHTVSTKRAA